MCKLICVTDRKLCGDFLSQIKAVAAARPDAVILREKDLSEEEYLDLAAQVKDICGSEDVPLIPHGFPRAAKALGAERLHLPLPLLEGLSPEERAELPRFGVSCHSAEDVRRAEQLGASYIIAGHIFDTDCKRGLPGRGVGFLREVCRSTALPVYAIGGISARSCSEVISAGAAGVCVMSSLMQTPDPAELIKRMRGGL